MRVVVVDYGVGNLHSVVKAIEHEGGSVEVTSKPDDVRNADRLVLPGVGAFGDGMRELTERGLVEPILRFAETARPLLGVCLGMQLLLSESLEFGVHPGLGIIPGKVIPIAPGQGVKIPQIGWNRIEPPTGATWDGTLLADVPVGSMVYFVHSFTAVPDNELHRLADASYGEFRVSAAIHDRSITGCQFHPEKSGPLGLRVISRFLL